MSITEAVIDLGAPIRLPDGLRSPFTRILRVDKTTPTRGDFATIAEAIAYAQTNGASATYDTAWRIEVGPGLHTEPFTLAAGIHLVGSGVRTCRIQCNGVVIQSGASVRGIYFLPPNGGSAASTGDTQALLCDILNTSNTDITDCTLYCDKNINQHVTALRVQGTGGGTVFVSGCYLYARNIYNGSGTDGDLSVMHIAPGCTSVVEARCNHYKSSSSTGKLKSPTLCWYEGGAASGYFQLDPALWSAERADDLANPPYLAKTNTTGTFAGRFPIVLGNAAPGQRMRVDIPVGATSEYLGVQMYDVVETQILEAQFAEIESLETQSLETDTLETQSLTLGGAVVGGNPPFAVGSFYTVSEWATGATGTAAVTLNTARTYPVRFQHTTTIDTVRLGASVGVASAVARVALYADDGAGNPGAKLQELGTVSGAATNEDIQLAASYTFTAGLRYHIYVGIEGAAATWRTITGHVPWYPTIGTGLSIGHTAAHTTGSTPTTFVSTGYTGAGIRVQLKPV